MHTELLAESSANFGIWLLVENLPRVCLGLAFLPKWLRVEVAAPVEAPTNDYDTDHDAATAAAAAAARGWRLDVA